MDSKCLYIIGAGTYGAAILDLAESNGYEVIGFFDDDLSKIGKQILGIPIVGKLENNKSTYSKDCEKYSHNIWKDNIYWESD